MALTINENKDFISEYIAYALACTDAPVSFHLIIVFLLLSAVVGRKIVVRFSHGNVYPNLWIILLGPSSISRKTTAINIGKRVLPPNLHYLAEESSPEGLISSLDLNGIGVLIRDEIGGFLQNLTRQYMKGFKEFLNNLFDCPDKYQRTLRNKEYNIENACVSILGATTKSRLLRNMNEDDLLSGFFARFIYILPSLENRKWKPVAHKKEEINVKESMLKFKLQELQEFFSKQKEPIILELDEDALKRYNDWLKEWEDRLMKEENVDAMSSIYSRLSTYAVKFAILQHVNNAVGDTNE